VENNRLFNHAVTHSPSLFDAPGTEAFALGQKQNEYERMNDCSMLKKKKGVEVGELFALEPVTYWY